MAEGDGRVSWYSLCYGESKTKGCGEGEGKECTMVRPTPSPLWQERAGPKGGGSAALLFGTLAREQKEKRSWRRSSTRGLS